MVALYVGDWFSKRCLPPAGYLTTNGYVVSIASLKSWC